MNASAFDIGWKDQRVQAFGPSWNPLDVTTEHAHEPQFLGGELEMRAAPIPALDFCGSLRVAASSLWPRSDGRILLGLLAGYEAESIGVVACESTVLDNE